MFSSVKGGTLEEMKIKQSTVFTLSDSTEMIIQSDCCKWALIFTISSQTWFSELINCSITTMTTSVCERFLTAGGSCYRDSHMTNYLLTVSFESWYSLSISEVYELTCATSYSLYASSYRRTHQVSLFLIFGLHTIFSQGAALVRHNMTYCRIYQEKLFTGPILSIKVHINIALKCPIFKIKGVKVSFFKYVIHQYLKDPSSYFFEI